MRPEDFRNALESIQPAPGDKDRMEQNILRSAGQQPAPTESRFGARVAAIAASLVILAAMGGVFLHYNGLLTPPPLPGTESTPTPTEQPTPTPAPTPTPDPLGAADGFLLNDYLVVDDKVYEPLPDPIRIELGIPEAIQPKDLDGWRVVVAGTEILTGDIIDIHSYVEGDVVDMVEVYRYLPMDCDAVIVVEKEEKYVFYRFAGFADDAGETDFADYLEVYGIRSAADIKEIQLLYFDEELKKDGQDPMVVDVNLLSEAELTAFYERFSALMGSGERFRELLDAEKNPDTLSAPKPTATPTPTPAPTPTPPDSEGLPQDGTDGNARPTPTPEPTPTPTPTPTQKPSLPPEETDGTVEYQYTLRVTAQNGLSFELSCYPDMGFLGNYLLTEDLFTAPLDGLKEYMLRG